MTRAGAGASRRYPRVYRVNEVLREVLATEVERITDADDRLGLLTVTGVVTEPDLRRATVLFASLSDDARDALAEHRVHLQSVISRQMRMKRTPQLVFEVDPAIVSGNRIEDVLRSIHGDEPSSGDEHAE